MYRMLALGAALHVAAFALSRPEDGNGSETPGTTPATMPPPVEAPPPPNADVVETGVPIETDGDDGDKNVSGGKASQALPGDTTGQAAYEPGGGKYVPEGKRVTFLDPAPPRVDGSAAVEQMVDTPVLPIAGAADGSLRSTHKSSDDGKAANEVDHSDDDLPTMRRRVAQERGYSDAKVMMMNADAVVEACLQLDAEAWKKAKELAASTAANKTAANTLPTMAPAPVPVIGNSGYNRMDRQVFPDADEMDEMRANGVPASVGF